MELVSIIMPCYNDGAYIEESIKSALAQTHKELELIIVDDGSDDPKTVNILQNNDWDRTIILHTDRLRPAGARNVGIAYASGKYILPLDSDDLIEPTYVEKALRIFKEQPDIGVVYCHADLFGEQNGKWDLPDYTFEKMLLDNIVFVTAMFLKEDWEAVGGFNLELKAGMEDYDFWLSILELGKGIHQLDEICFHYRIKPQSRTTRFMDDRQSVKSTYRRIYANHPQLYERHKNLYAVVLRDALIDQIFDNRALYKGNELYERFKRHPWIFKLIKWFIKR